MNGGINPPNPMKTLLIVSLLIITLDVLSQTTFNNAVTVNSGIAVAPTNVYANGLSVRMPVGSFGQGINVINAYSNLLTLDKVGYLTVPSANLGDHAQAGSFWVGDHSVALSGWPAGMLTATNLTSPNAYVPIAASSYLSGTNQGLTTNINVITSTGTNQLQFTGGILTGVLSQ